jgi:SAM-dependent methyltransferase
LQIDKGVETMITTASETTAALEDVVACDLCGGRVFDVRRRWRDNLLFGRKAWTLVECRRCSLVFLDPRPTREQIGAFYPSAYTAHTDAPHRAKPWHRRVSSRGSGPIARHDIYTRIRQDLSWYRMPEWRGEGRVLDIGCGNGSRYLDVLHALGWKTFGIDASPAAVACLRAKGHHAVVGTAEDRHFPPASMDVVTMWHLLEHVHSPTKALQIARDTLRPGGVLSLSVPNYHSLQATVLRGLWCGSEAPRHLYQFTRKTLRDVIESSGFRIVSLSTRSGATSLPRAVRHGINRVFGTRLGHDPAWIVALFEPLAIFGSLMRYFGIGCDLRVIAERA